jgi:hypothetical protein
MSLMKQFHRALLICGLSLALTFMAACQSSPNQPQTAGTNQPSEEASKPASTGEATHGGSSAGTANEKAEAPPAPPREFVLPAGTVIRAALEETLDTRSTPTGEPFQLRVSTPITIDGATVVPADSIITGRVAESKPSGRIKGRAEMTLAFDTLKTPAGSFRIVAQPIRRQAPGTKKRDAAIIGAGAGIGAAIGAIAGGGKGAAIGAATGGGAGTGVVLATRGKPVQFKTGERLTVKLAEPLKLPLS